LQVRLQLRFYPVASVLVLILAAYLGSAWSSLLYSATWWM
jgi:hypothetical protein